jgi:C1A family cysteine protease
MPSNAQVHNTRRKIHSTKTSPPNQVNFIAIKEMLVSDVGEQGQCKSGYAFATVAAVESSMYKIFKQI